jgi:RNA polymerase sigma factor (sigma-70 family)
MPTDTDNRTDNQLLQYFTARKDEEAFAELVRRHGPMVLGVCRQMLRNEQDAEDTFQATFMVLARKASSIRIPEALPSWLYGVASRLAMRSRLATSRRQAQEVPLADLPAKEEGPGSANDDLKPILHEEIGLLPDRYRIPFMLCYMDGKTNEEAARQLGCPPGTVFSRLARARERLRKRLGRRGVAISSGLLAGLLASFPREAAAAVSADLAVATVRHAVLFAASTSGPTGAIPAAALGLTQNYLRAMRGRRLLGIALGLTLSALFCALGGLLLLLSPGEKPIGERLLGSWTLQSWDMGGVRVDQAARLSIAPDRMTMSAGGVDVSGPYRIDEKKNPMRIDWTANEKTVHAILKLEGEILTISHGLAVGGQPPDQAPADFSPGPGKAVMVYVRQQP